MRYFLFIVLNCVLLCCYIACDGVCMVLYCVFIWFSIDTTGIINGRAGRRGCVWGVCGDSRGVWVNVWVMGGSGAFFWRLPGVGATQLSGAVGACHEIRERRHRLAGAGCAIALRCGRVWAALGPAAADFAAARDFSVWGILKIKKYKCEQIKKIR